MPGHFYILVSLALFFIGTAGALLRRNAIFVLMSMELQLGAGSLALLTFARGLGDQKGHLVAFFVMAMAAAEAAVGLAIVVSVYRANKKIDLDGINELRN
ncbi:MAG TPA: NADH-quinone oxidoreductase subunit NuoK [Polyangia bacterium]|jgi:NADH-quinone oxidoreductase subunit K